MVSSGLDPPVTRGGTAHNNSCDEIAVHPRKRKALRQRHTEQSTTVDSSYSFFPKNNTTEKTANPYEMFLDIRKKVAKRRNDMTVVTPKAPTGFNNYLMVSCNYVLQGTSSSKLNIPMLTPPNSLQDDMKELFKEQEKARYKLRLQHVIERVCNCFYSSFFLMKICYYLINLFPPLHSRRLNWKVPIHKLGPPHIIHDIEKKL